MADTKTDGAAPQVQQGKPGAAPAQAEKNSAIAELHSLISEAHALAEKLVKAGEHSVHGAFTALRDMKGRVGARLSVIKQAEAEKADQAALAAETALAAKVKAAVAQGMEALQAKAEELKVKVSKDATTKVIAAALVKAGYEAPAAEKAPAGETAADNIGKLS